MKLKYALLALTVGAVISAGVSYAQTISGKDLPTFETVKNINDLKYPEEAWDPKLWAMSEMGSALLKGVDISVDPPPANDSPQTRAELDLLRKYMKEARTPETVEKIMSEHAGKFDFPFRPEGEKVAKVGAMTERELNYYLMKIKRDYERPRPTQLAPDITTMFDVPPHAAYPSGHSTQTHMAALVFGYIDPAHKDAFWTYADDVARRREIAGVHYPSDGKAGAQLATAIFNKLLENKEFRTAIDDAKADFDATHTN